MNEVNSFFRELTLDEVHCVSGGDSETATIIVTGQRVNPYSFSYGSGMSRYHGGGQREWDSNTNDQWDNFATDPAPVDSDSDDPGAIVVTAQIAPQPGDIVVNGARPTISFPDFAGLFSFRGMSDFDFSEIIQNLLSNFDPNLETHDSRQCAAEDAVQAIKNQPNYTTQEYGYFLLRDAAGNVTKGPMLTSGSAGRIDFGGDNKLSLAETGATSWNQVVGFVHNHPYQTDNPMVPGNINAINRQPSPSDWEILIAIDGLNGANDFILYIIGPDGITRAYDPDDSRTRASDEIIGDGC